jgi:hypothetical protein
MAGPRPDRAPITRVGTPPRVETDIVATIHRPRPEPRVISLQGDPRCAERYFGHTQDNPSSWTVFSEMNHRVTPSPKGGFSRTLRCFSLLLLPALAPKVAHSLPRTRPLPDTERRRTNETPYLQAFGALPLRFTQPTPPPEALTQPTAAAPPNPAQSLTETAVAQANAAAAQSTTPSLPEPSLLPDASIAPAKPTPDKAGPTPILPDDTRPAPRHEEALPYFLAPGAGRGPGQVNVIVPVPITQSPAPAIPPSSATYTQSPR